MTFWDSSALVPLVIAQRSTPTADAWAAADPQIVVWTLTEVEIVSALRRLVREGKLSEAQSVAAETLAEEILESAHVLTDVARVKPLAGRLLRTHSLRAAGALQLGAALAWADGDPAGLAFLTLDRRLAEAARREGFRVEPTA